MHTKMTQLEDRLNVKKEQLLEKELVLEEVGSLSERLRFQAVEGREETLDIAKTVNEFQARIKKVTRRLMACVSELSMYQVACFICRLALVHRHCSCRSSPSSPTLLVVVVLVALLLTSRRRCLRRCVLSPRKCPLGRCLVGVQVRGNSQPIHKRTLYSEFDSNDTKGTGVWTGCNRLQP